MQADIGAMPGWKRNVERSIDAIAERAFLGVNKAVRWNTPLYGKDDGWIFSMHGYKRYVQLTFMRGVLWAIARRHREPSPR